ncbi:MAG: hypothetical protein HRU36_04845 [Rickettsiales bacterium]|nr:hypothetical protein [Rickettsiales bacterium]
MSSKTLKEIEQIIQQSVKDAFYYESAYFIAHECCYAATTMMLYQPWLHPSCVATVKTLAKIHHEGGDIISANTTVKFMQYMVKEHASLVTSSLGFIKESARYVTAVIKTSAKITKEVVWDQKITPLKWGADVLFNYDIGNNPRPFQEGFWSKMIFFLEFSDDAILTIISDKIFLNKLWAEMNNTNTINKSDISYIDIGDCYMRPHINVTPLNSLCDIETLGRLVEMDIPIIS